MVSDQPEEERRLVARTLAGDLSAFESLVARYEKRVYHLALRLLGSPPDAEDAAQEAFMRAFASLGSFRGQARFGTWLYRITVNACRDLVRRRRRFFPVAPAGASGLSPARDDPQEEASRAELRASVEQAIAALPYEFREAVLLRDLQGLTYEEMAQVLGVPLGTVKSRIHRGRQLLRQHLEEPEPPPGVQKTGALQGAPPVPAPKAHQEGLQGEGRP